MKKKFLAMGLLLGAASLSFGLMPAAAESNYPVRPLTIVVPFSAGGRTDAIGRIVVQELSQQLGKPIAVINKPGASGVLGEREVASSAPDGYTLGFFSSAAVTSQYTVPTPIALSNFKLVAIVNTDPAAIAVQWNAPWKSLKDLVAYARKHPGKLKLGMIPGASAQIFAAGFESAAGVKVIDVPFKGDAPGAIALAGGHIDIHVAVPVSYRSLVAAKKVRMLAVADRARSPLYNNTPTFRENGVDLVIGSFHGIYVPKATPQPIIDKLADAAERTMKSKKVIDTMNNVGAGLAFMRGKQAQEYLAMQDKTYRGIIDKLGLRASKKK